MRGRGPGVGLDLKGVAPPNFAAPPHHSSNSRKERSGRIVGYPLLRTGNLDAFYGHCYALLVSLLRANNLEQVQTVSQTMRLATLPLVHE